MKDIAILMLETGMRPEEIYRLEAENIHVTEGFLFNPHGKTKAARRKVPLNKKAGDLLESRMRLSSRN